MERTWFCLGCETSIAEVEEIAMAVRLKLDGVFTRNAESSKHYVVKCFTEYRVTTS